MSLLRGLRTLALACCTLSCIEGGSPPTGEVSAPEPTEPQRGNVGPDPSRTADPAVPEGAAAPPSDDGEAPGVAAGSACVDAVVPDSVVVRTQDDVDALSGCERVVGDLWLRGGPDLDYTPLRSLRDVEGAIKVQGQRKPGASLLEGLRGLVEAGGLQLSGLALESLAPLSGLRRLGASSSALPAPSESGDQETSYSGLTGLAISDCAGLTSLAGLRSLEELDVLDLRDNPHLVSLAGLDALAVLPRLQLIGGVVEQLGGVPVRNLSVWRSAWADLSVLGDVRGLDSLDLIENAALVTLTGAQLPDHLEGLSIENNPALANLHGLEALVSADSLSISTARWSNPIPPPDSQLTSLDGLRGLERVGHLSVYGQSRLRSLAGLEALADVEHLELSDNTALESVEALAQLERVGAFYLQGSPALDSLSGFGPARVGALLVGDLGIADLTGLEAVSVETDFSIWGGPELVSLSGLPQLGPNASVSLERLPVLGDLEPLEALASLGSLTLIQASVPRFVAPGLQQLRSITAWDNPELEELSFPALRTIDQLQVVDNHGLVRLDLRQLEAAGQLDITSNSLLYEGALETLLALGATRAVIAQNGTLPAQRSPCPWTGDGLCDELSGVCAEGTDATDCAAP